MKKLLVTLTLITGSLFFFASCTKTGPMGPQGPVGPQGNANVNGGNAFTVQSWPISGNLYQAQFNYAAITADIVNYGVVEVFKQYPDGSWTNLPDISGKTSTVFNFYVGGFDIFVQNSDGSLPIYPGTINFRTVVITSSLRQSHPNTNWKNYKEVMKVLEEEKAVSSQTISGSVTVGQ